MPEGLIPSFRDGFLYKNLVLAQNPEEAKLTLFDTRANESITLSLWPDEPTLGVTIKGVARAKDHIVVGVRYISPDNRRAEVIARFDRSGKLVNRFRTNPFAWDAFAVDGDGSVWLFGLCPDYLKTTCGSKDFARLRRYSPDGTLIDGFLPTGDVDDRGPWQANTFPQLFMTDRSIYVLDSVLGRMYVVSRGGELERDTRLVFPEAWTNVRMGATSDGRLFAGASGTGKVYEMRLDEGTFRPVTDDVGWFYGIESGRVVVARWRMGEGTELVDLPVPEAR